MRKVLRPLALLVCALAIFAGAGTASAADRYVALGDSYSSGTGTNYYNLSSSCLRGTYAYPYQVAAQRGNTSLVFPACSGATTTDVMNNQIGYVTSDTRFVTITIGGNDAGFSSVMISCVTFGCQSAISSARSYIQYTLPSRLNTVYSAIRNRAPNATVIVVGYPRLFTTYGCLSTTGIDSNERTQLNGMADLLRDVIRSRATAYGFRFVDAIPRFSTHAVCTSGEWLNGMNIISTSESFHPNRSGHTSGYTPLVRAITG